MRIQILPRIAAGALALAAAPSLPPPPDTAATQVQRSLDDLGGGRYADALSAAQAVLRMPDITSRQRAAAGFCRVLALVALGQTADARTAAVALADEAEPVLLSSMVPVFVEVGDPETATALLSRFVARFPDQSAALNVQAVRDLLPWIKRQHGERAFSDAVVGLAKGGFGGADIEAHDSTAVLAMGILLARGVVADATALAATLVSRPMIVLALTDRTYQPVWSTLAGSAGQHLERAGRAAVIQAEHDLQADPKSIAARTTMLRAYRDAGDLAAADRVGADFMADAESLSGLDERGMWLVNDHAYVLVALGRGREADARWAAINALPIADHRWLINTFINRGAALVSQHRDADALPVLAIAASAAETYGSPYARQVIRGAQACALHRLGREAEAAPFVAALVAHAAETVTATADGLMCIGRVADAAAAVVASLGRPDDARSAIDYLQPASVSPWNGSQPLVPIDPLLAQPTVASALARVGRVLPPDLRPTRVDR